MEGKYYHTVNTVSSEIFHYFTIFQLLFSQVVNPHLVYKACSHSLLAEL